MVSPSVAGAVQDISVGHVTYVINSNCCATWFVLTRHGGLDLVGSFDSFLIVFHALRLLCVISSSCPPSFFQLVCFQII